MLQDLCKALNLTPLLPPSHAHAFRSRRHHPPSVPRAIPRHHRPTVLSPASPAGQKESKPPREAPRQDLSPFPPLSFSSRQQRRGAPVLPSSRLNHRPPPTPAHRPLPSPRLRRCRRQPKFTAHGYPSKPRGTPSLFPLTNPPPTLTPTPKPNPYAPCRSWGGGHQRRKIKFRTPQKHRSLIESTFLSVRSAELSRRPGRN